MTFRKFHHKVDGPTAEMWLFVWENTLNKGMDVEVALECAKKNNGIAKIRLNKAHRNMFYFSIHLIVIIFPDSKIVWPIENLTKTK